MPVNVSFLERFENISKIEDAYKLSRPGASASEAQDYARSLEEAAFGQNDLESYQSHIDVNLGSLETSQDANVSIEQVHDEPDVDLTTGGMSIGRYVNAVHHRDGLFSDVFKAVAIAESGVKSETEGFQKYPFLVALKVTNPSATEPPHDSKREVELLEKLRHVRIVELLESFSHEGGRLVLAFPFMQYTLEDQLAKGKLAKPDQLSLLSHIMQGLEYIHGQGIIHRDMKPSNILLKSPRGPAYIADFGIAWSDDSSSSEPVDQKILDVGTTCYRPPELMFGKQWYDTSLDMWALGCVVAQVVSLGGETLFDSGDLGSDLALIKSIFSTLGTPNLQVWPEAKNLPDWGKMAFREYPAKPWEEILPGASQAAIDLVKMLVAYESNDRMKAKDWNKQGFFDSLA